MKGIWEFLILCIFLKSDIILKQIEKNVLAQKSPYKTSRKKWLQTKKMLREGPSLDADLGEIL